MLIRLDETFDPELHLNYNAIVGKAKRRGLNVREPIYEYMREMEQSEDVYVAHHFKKLREQLEDITTKREYTRYPKNNVVNREYDVKGEIEKCGFSQYSRGLTVIYSLEDSLDYLFYRIFNIHPSQFREGLQRNMDRDSGYRGLDYKLVSRGFISGVGENLGKLSFGLFYDISPNLDNFFFSLRTNVDKNVRIKDYFSEFINIENFDLTLAEKCSMVFSTIIWRYVWKLSSQLTITTSLEYERYTDEASKFVLASKGLYDLVYYTNNKEGIKDIILQEGKFDYKVKALSVKAGEYGEKVGEDTCYLLGH